LVFICLFIHVWCPDASCHPSNLSLTPDKPRRKRSKEPKPFTGLIHKPLCEACEQRADGRPKAPGSPPPVITFTKSLSPAPRGGEPCAGVPRGREHPLGQGWGQSPTREAPVSSRAEGRGSTRLYSRPSADCRYAVPFLSRSGLLAAPG